MNDAVSYSGATYIGIRSMKHVGSSAFSHLQDMKRIRSLSEFSTSFKDDRNGDKKVMIELLMEVRTKIRGMKIPSTVPSSILKSAT